MALNAVNNVQTAEYKPSKKGRIVGSVAGMGTGSVYVAATMKDTIALQKAEAAKIAMKTKTSLQKHLKAIPKNVALASASVILGTTLLGTAIGAIVDKVKDNKAQAQAEKQVETQS